jgi:hypothetical protein
VVVKKILCVSHVFPREVDDFDHLVTQLKIGSTFLQNQVQFDFDIILNLNPSIIDWGTSQLPKEFFVDKMRASISKLDWCNGDFKIVEDSSIFGLLEQRTTLTKTFPDYFGYLILDNDIIIDDFALYILENAVNTIEDTTEYVLTPQPYCYWDSSWDIISYEKFVNGFDVNEFNAYQIKGMGNSGDVQLAEVPSFKFAGGWFTFITKDLLSKVPFPDVRGYGMEDTYISMFFNKMKSNGENVRQYVMKNVLVQENRKYLMNSVYTKFVNYNIEYLKSINENSKQMFWNEIQKLNM